MLVPRLVPLQLIARSAPRGVVIYSNLEFRTTRGCSNADNGRPSLIKIGRSCFEPLAWSVSDPFAHAPNRTKRVGQSYRVDRSASMRMTLVIPHEDIRSRHT